MLFGVALTRDDDVAVFDRDRNDGQDVLLEFALGALDLHALVADDDRDFLGDGDGKFTDT